MKTVPEEKKKEVRLNHPCLLRDSVIAFTYTAETFLLRTLTDLLKLLKQYQYSTKTL